MSQIFNNNDQEYPKNMPTDKYTILSGIIPGDTKS